MTAIQQIRLLWISCAFCVPIYADVLPSLEAELSHGLMAYREQRMTEALKNFLTVLQEDPQNVQAHTYIHLISQNLETSGHTQTQATRLELLAKASRALEEQRQDPQPMDAAILDTTQAETRAREARWHALCEEARTEDHLGHFLEANDVILRVLAENPNHLESQQVLSDLQSHLREILDKGLSLSAQERFALEGFYAYGQADYATADTAWEKARTLLTQSVPAADAPKQLGLLRFDTYAKVARAHVDEERHAADIRALFQKGVALYEARHFVQALEIFRQIAIANPEYPQLSAYLIPAEAAAEEDRTRFLSEERRQKVITLFNQGVHALEQSRYAMAEQSFQELLRLDPSHPQALAYLQLVQAEIQKRSDPKIAQQHYETGVIAYAGGKLEEAKREWAITLRMDPHHEKALKALSKVDRELVLYRDIPPP